MRMHDRRLRLLPVRISPCDCEQSFHAEAPFPSGPVPIEDSGPGEANSTTTVRWVPPGTRVIACNKMQPFPRFPPLPPNVMKAAGKLKDASLSSLSLLSPGEMTPLWTLLLHHSLVANCFSMEELRSAPRRLSPSISQQRTNLGFPRGPSRVTSVLMALAW